MVALAQLWLVLMLAVSSEPTAIEDTARSNRLQTEQDSLSAFVQGKPDWRRQWQPSGRVTLSFGGSKLDVRGDGSGWQYLGVPQESSSTLCIGVAVDLWKYLAWDALDFVVLNNNWGGAGRIFFRTGVSAQYPLGRFVPSLTAGAGFMPTADGSASIWDVGAGARVKLLSMLAINADVRFYHGHGQLSVQHWKQVSPGLWRIVGDPAAVWLDATTLSIGLSYIFWRFDEE
jgi:hypothetical protein